MCAKRQIHNEYNENNIAISPYGALSVLIALGEGVQGDAVLEIQQCAKIPNDISIIRVGLRDIHRHLKSYFIPKEGFLAGLTLNHDNVTLRTEYEDVLKFYGFDIFTFNNGLYPEPETTIKPYPKTELPMTSTERTTDMASSELTTMPITTTTEIPTTYNIPRTIETIATETNPRITTAIVTEETTLEFKTIEPKFEGAPQSTDVTVTDILTTDTSKLSNPTTLTTTVIPVTQTPTPQGTTMSRIQFTTQALGTENVPTSADETETTTITVEEDATTIQRTTREIPTETTTTTIERTTTQETETKKTTDAPPQSPAITDSIVTTILTTETEIPTMVNIPSSETTTSLQTSEGIQSPDDLQTISGVETTEGVQIVERAQTTQSSQTTGGEIIQTTDRLQTIESLQTTENSQTTNTIQILDNLQSIRSVQTEMIQSNDRLETADNLQMTESSQTPENIQVTTEPSSGKENLVTMPVTRSQNKDTNQVTAAINEVVTILTETFTDATTLLSYPYPENGVTRNQIDNEIIPVNNTGALEMLKRDARSQKIKIEKDVIQLNVFHNNDHRYHRRKTRSLVDYIIAKYYDDLHFPRHNERAYVPEEQLGFLVNGKLREYQINFMKYDAVLPFYYVPHLNAAALSFPLDNVNYYLLLVLPVEENGLDQLICDIRLNESIKYIIDNLKYTHVIATIPSFELKGYVNLTPSIQKLGIQRIFEPRQADFSPMTDHRNVYVTNIEQAITVNIRNYMDPNALEGNRNLRQYEPLEFKVDHPFLYFVLDSELHVTLMAGKIINPLNARIR